LLRTDHTGVSCEHGYGASGANALRDLRLIAPSATAPTLVAGIPRSDIENDDFGAGGNG
jgi:hypothetical protein